MAGVSGKGLLFMQMSSEELRQQMRRQSVFLSFMVLLQQQPLTCCGCCSCLAPDSCLVQRGAGALETQDAIPGPLFPQLLHRLRFKEPCASQHLTDTEGQGSQSNLEQTLPAWTGFMPLWAFPTSFLLLIMFTGKDLLQDRVFACS